LFKFTLLKKYFYVIAILTIVCGYEIISASKKETNNSLSYSIDLPSPLNNTEIDHYHEILSDFFESTLLKNSFNGGILVAKGGNIIYEKYKGKINLKKDDPITDSTSFHIASTGKTFTSIAILQLVQDNRLSLNDTLNKFFPEFPYEGITVEMLLNHHSGLPNYLYFMSESGWDQHQYVTNNDVLRYLDSLKPSPVFSAGKRYNYCNTNFVILALLIEKITGKSFPVYMKENFFVPLHMDHTYVYTAGDSATATPSFNYNKSLWKNDFLELTYGDKNIYSTPRDLLKWDQALYGDELLSKDLKYLAFTPSIYKTKDSIPVMHNYGLGFHLMITPTGKKVIYHFGRWHGFNAAFARLTDEKVTIIILGNKFTRSIYNTAVSTYKLFGNYSPNQDYEKEDNEKMPENKITKNYLRSNTTKSPTKK